MASPPSPTRAGSSTRSCAESHAGNSENGEAGAGGIVSAGLGLTTISTDETGKLRVLTEPVVVEGTRIGTFRVADPLTSVDQALASLRNRFIAVGLGALLLSVIIAIWLANLISRPLRRMAAVASAVDSGISPTGSTTAARTRWGSSPSPSTT